MVFAESSAFELDVQDGEADTSPLYRTALFEGALHDEGDPHLAVLNVDDHGDLPQTLAFAKVDESWASAGTTLDSYTNNVLHEYKFMSRGAYEMGDAHSQFEGFSHVFGGSGNDLFVVFKGWTEVEGNSGIDTFVLDGGTMHVEDYEHGKTVFIDHKAISILKYLRWKMISLSLKAATQESPPKDRQEKY